MKWIIFNEAEEMLIFSPEVTVLKNKQEILSLAVDGDYDFFEVAFDIKGKERVVAAIVFRCKNGHAINYTEKYMHRWNPDCMVLSDDERNNKTYFKELFDKSLGEIRLIRIIKKNRN